jgi:hypothetical protein
MTRIFMSFRPFGRCRRTADGVLQAVTDEDVLSISGDLIRSTAVTVAERTPWRALASRLAGPLAALCWVAACLRWFDPAAGWRPSWLLALPPLPLFGLALTGAVLWLRPRWRLLSGPRATGTGAALLLVVALALLFRLPLAVKGAAGYTTADAALSGIVALHARDGIAHHVFVPMVPYSGSLKSHLAALAGLVIDMPQAFTLASVGFYLLFVAALFRLGLLLGGARVALLAGLYGAFAPTFVTQYSLSNDGNYVEVLALGTWTLVLATRYLDDRAARPALALAMGLLLGLAFWCHILAVIHLATIGLILLAVERLRAPRRLGSLLAGFALGYVPGLLWNARHGWASLAYVVPGGYWDAARHAGGAAAGVAPGFARRVQLLLLDHGPVLFGYDQGYPPLLDSASRALAWLGLLAALLAAAWAGRAAFRERRLDGRAVLLLFGLVNVAAVLLALPHIPGNPRYVLFLFAPAAVFLALAFGDGRRRFVLLALVAFGALGALGQARGKLEAAAGWESLVARLEREGVRFCYSDFYLAAPITFLSGERIVCSSKLGPTTTEYFFEYRARVDDAPEAAIVAVNSHSASRMEGRLRELGVSYERLDLMKPVLLRLSRKVDPAELFPGRDFRMR